MVEVNPWDYIKMTQYEYRVNLQRDKLAAEKWAKGIKSIHVHQLKSMWYDNRPQDTNDGAVTDIQYNDSTVERRKNGKIIHTFGTPLIGEELLYKYSQSRNTD